MTKINLRYPKPLLKVYEPVRKCIYCGGEPPNSELSKEHIIALGLSGSLILPRASCPKCRDITGDVEGTYLQRMIPEVRQHLNLASRRKRRNKKPPPPLLVGRLNASGEIVRRDALPKHMHPYWVNTCGLAPPGVLSTKPDWKPFVEVVMLPGQDWQRRWGTQRPNVAVEYFFSSDTYARMLAKIAHSFAVAELGLDGFEPVLPPFILEESKTVYQYVGGPLREDDDRSAKPDVLHSIELTRKDGWVIVRLRLLAFVEGTPSYIILAGRTA